MSEKCDICEKSVEKILSICTDQWNEEKWTAINFKCCQEHNKIEIDNYVFQCLKKDANRNDDLNIGKLYK